MVTVQQKCCEFWKFNKFTYALPRLDSSVLYKIGSHCCKRIVNDEKMVTRRHLSIVRILVRVAEVSTEIIFIMVTLYTRIVAAARFLLWLCRDYRTVYSLWEHKIRSYMVIVRYDFSFENTAVIVGYGNGYYCTYTGFGYTCDGGRGARWTSSMI